MAPEHSESTNVSAVIRIRMGKNGISRWVFEWWLCMLRINCTRLRCAETERAPSGAIATIGITGIIGKVCPVSHEFSRNRARVEKRLPRREHAAKAVRAKRGR